jgi:hypothetical protein
VVAYPARELIRRKSVPLSDYFNPLFIDANISNTSDMDRYSRYLDAAIAQESIKLDDIIGVGEAPGGLHVVSHHAVMRVGEFGIFKKRVEARLVTAVASIAKLATKDAHPTAESIKFEGQTETIFSITGWDSGGRVVLDIKWQSGSGSQKIVQQRDHLFKLLGEATGMTRRARVGLKPLSSRGEYLVDLLADGNSYQFLGKNPNGVWMFRGEFDGALDAYKEQLAVVEPQWTVHVAANLYE